MSTKIPYPEIMDRIKDDVDYIVDEAYKDGFEDGKQAVIDVLNRLNQEGVDGKYSFADYKIIHSLAKIQSKHK